MFLVTSLKHRYVRLNNINYLTKLKNSLICMQDLNKVMAVQTSRKCPLMDNKPEPGGKCYVFLPVNDISRT